MARLLVLAGTTKGLFAYSTDGEARDAWTVDAPMLPGWEVTSVGVVGGASGDPPRWIVGTTHYAYGATLRLSDDLGKCWRQIEKGPAYDAASGFKLNRIWQVQQDPHDPDTVYAGVDEAGLFVSRDRGERWTEVDTLTRHPSRPKWFAGGGGLCLHTIIADHSNPRRMWVGISAVGCFRTDDAGATWTACNSGLVRLPTGSDDPAAVHCVHKIVQHPTKPDSLFMQYHGGVFRSDNGASTWTKIEHGLPGNFGFPMVVTRGGTLCIAPLANEEMRVFKDGRVAIFRSTDEGDTWHGTTTGLPQESSYVGILRDAMTIDAGNPTGIYFGTTMGHVYASADSGASWNKLPGEVPRVLSVKTCHLA